MPHHSAKQHEHIHKKILEEAAGHFDIPCSMVLDGPHWVHYLSEKNKHVTSGARALLEIALPEPCEYHGTQRVVFLKKPKCEYQKFRQHLTPPSLGFSCTILGLLTPKHFTKFGCTLIATMHHPVKDPIIVPRVLVAITHHEHKNLTIDAFWSKVVKEKHQHVCVFAYVLTPIQN